MPEHPDRVALRPAAGRTLEGSKKVRIVQAGEQSFKLCYDRGRLYRYGTSRRISGGHWEGITSWWLGVVGRVSACGPALFCVR